MIIQICWTLRCGSAQEEEESVLIQGPCFVQISTPGIMWCHRDGYVGTEVG